MSNETWPCSGDSSMMEDANLKKKKFNWWNKNQWPIPLHSFSCVCVYILLYLYSLVTDALNNIANILQATAFWMNLHVSFQQPSVNTLATWLDEAHVLCCWQFWHKIIIMLQVSVSLPGFKKTKFKHNIEAWKSFSHSHNSHIQWN